MLFEFMRARYTLDELTVADKKKEPLEVLPFAFKISS